MNEGQITWDFVGILIFFFCCHCGLLLYFCRYLRTRGVADVSFTGTLVMALTGNIQKFYKSFYATHSKEYGKVITKTLIVWQFSSVGLIIVLPVVLSFMG
ncbi:MAG: hypothetical protein JRG71_00545 [Deltaproteobacteria bacterium]|jgi:hypothetical protein|nr:hypothetical protein [Deltaproteobacteria bacterium]